MLTSNLLSKLWNSSILTWNPSANAPPERRNAQNNHLNFEKAIRCWTSGMLLLYTEANAKVLLNHPFRCDCLIWPTPILYIFWNKVFSIFFSISKWKVSASFPHLLLASLEPSESWHSALLLQTQRKFDPLPGLDPPHPAHPPGNWYTAPCAAGAPEG